MDPNRTISIWLGWVVTNGIRDDPDFNVGVCSVFPHNPMRHNVMCLHGRCLSHPTSDIGESS